MVGDWSGFDVDERGAKALWADRELQWNGAGDSYYRSCGSRRWSAHQRTRSPLSTHRYPHSYLHSPSPSSSHTHRHHSLPFSPPPSALQNHHDDPFNHHHQQQYKSIILPKPRASKRPATNAQISQRIQNSDFRFHKAPKTFVESDRHNTRDPGGTRTLDLTMKLHDTGTQVVI